MSLKRRRKSKRGSKKRADQTLPPMTPEEKAYMEAEAREAAAFWDDFFAGIFAAAHPYVPPKSAEIIPFPKAKKPPTETRE